MTPTTLPEALERIDQLNRLVLAMADKLATVAEHLSRLAEKPEVRHVAHPESKAPIGAFEESGHPCATWRTHASEPV